MILATSLVAGCSTDMPDAHTYECSYPGDGLSQSLHATATIAPGGAGSFAIVASTNAALDRSPGVCSIDSNDFQDAQWTSSADGVVFHTSNLRGEGLYDVLIKELPDAIQIDFRSMQCSEGMLPFKIAIPKNGTDCGVDW